METDAETPVTGIMPLSWNGHSNGVNGIAERDHANTNDNHRRRSSTNSTHLSASRREHCQDTIEPVLGVITPSAQPKKSGLSRQVVCHGIAGCRPEDIAMIIVSNRLPFVLKENEDGTLCRHSSAGGLVTAMAPIVCDSDGVWVGWAGVHLEAGQAIPEGNPQSSIPGQRLKCSQIRAVDIDPDMFNEYYNGCCNTSFWPTFHSMPDRAVFKREYWKSYSLVNSQFTKATAKAFRGTFVRWQTKEGLRRFKIAFFLHIPFPPWDVFRLFPWDDEILVGLLGCDLIGFHVDGYAENFLECCQKRLGLVVDRERKLVQHDGRTVVVQAFPIGVPFKQFEELAEQADAETVDPRLKLILGVDRLDYTKGIIHRVRGFERLLDTYPEHLESVVLLQVAVPSRTDVQEYQELKDELDREIGRINGRFSTTRWSPIRYIYRFMKQEELCAFYREAFVALVTPIRDGMNLVAKEFVACQIKEPGVLILSPFTGAGETMHEALLVNPLEETGLADTIHRALTMPLDERELRMSALRRRERTYDVHKWVQTFLRATGTFQSGDRDSHVESLTIEHFEKWLACYVDDSSKLVLLLDYDGTLAPIAQHPDDAHLPKDTRAVLEHLTEMPDVYVAVISGRSISNVKAMVGIKGITYAGNHGLDIEHPDGTTFIHPDQAKFKTLIGGLKTELERDVCREGAWVENKGVIMTYHYRNVHQNERLALTDQATAIILRHGFRPCKGHCAIEARPPIHWDKGRACIHVLRTTFGVDWSERVRIIYVGDDATDEDAMQALCGMAVTFRVTNSSMVVTAANHRLNNTRCVYMLLQWVEQYFEKRNKRCRKYSRSSSGGSPIDTSLLDAGRLYR
ncbi:Bifunctional trehalose-6-phosphate synthase/phosphatase [Lamellibrachia satsuma]|nr:Bifunctional trehalose-6-phosphate synthase/phosphatase [Lamellibrachia satsuma]